MVFNSAVFIFFLAVVVVLYWTLSRFSDGQRLQNRFLLIASYFFYGYWDWLFLGLIMISTTGDFFVGRYLDRIENPGRRRALITVSVVLNLTFLGIFKYYDFFIGSFVAMSRSIFPSTFPDGGESLFLHVILPVGISFYTFQSMSYTIDVYRRTIKAEKNFLDFALFVSFFAQLVAGPINRADELLVQVKKARIFKLEDIRNGLWLILLGFFMKVYVADNLAPIVSQVYLPGKLYYELHPVAAAGHGGAQVLLASIGFAFQIYGDFAGYSFIAMGSASLLGFRLPMNFITPEMSQNPVELWRRWHVSLNRWVTDYIYIPLGGSRMGEFNKQRNIFLAFLLMGLWHGASWTFLFWGVFHGAWIVLHSVLQPYLPRLPDSAPAALKTAVKIAKMVLVFSTFGLTATFFRAYDLNHIILLWKSIFTFPWDLSENVNGVPAAGVYFMDLFQKIWILIALDIAMYRSGNNPVWVFKKPVWARSLIYIVLFFMILTLGVFGKDVIYFAF